MIEILGQISNRISNLYFTKQVVVILALFLIGLICTSTLLSISLEKNNKAALFAVLLAYPFGLSVFVLSGLLCLICNIKYTVSNILIVMGIFLILLGILSFFFGKNNKNTLEKKVGGLFLNNRKIYALSIIAVIVIAVISTSGVISIGFSNDSMYYYSAYPHEIVKGGYLTFKFDTFLTDAGQGTAVINTLPFLFGFNESFGIQNFFNINFCIFFIYVLFEEAVKYFDRKKSIAISCLALLLMLTSLPFVIISKWILANVYFMELMFICLYINYRFLTAESDGILVIRTVLILMLSFVRIEGALFSGFLVLCYMMLKNVKIKDIVCMTLPVAIMQAMYFIRIYATMTILAPYTFMSKEKAFIAVFFNVAVMIYGLFLSLNIKLFERFKTILSPVNVTFVALAGVNVLLFIADRHLFMSNVISFIKNATGSSGWGFFPAVVIAFIILVPKVKIECNYFDFFWLGFLLITFAACFARGDELRVSLYDSGNRVLLQIVPFVIFAFAYRFINAFNVLNKLHQKEQ